MSQTETKEKKLPPLEKIAEAYSVLADHRIEAIDAHTFLVTSSNGEKQYKVVCNDNHYRSNDSATKFVRYAGYPVLAVLMYQKRLPVPEQYLSVLKGINWNAINKKYKRDYAAALDAALEEKQIPTQTIQGIKEAMKACFEAFIRLDITV